MNNPCKECPYERDKYCDCIEFAKYDSYLNGARDFAEWAEDKDYFDDYHTPFLGDMLTEWQKGKE